MNHATITPTMAPTLTPANTPLTGETRRSGMRVLWEIGTGEGSRRLSVNVRLDGRRAGVSAMMLGDGQSQSYDAQGSVVVDRDNGLMHIDAPGVLSMSIAPSDNADGARLLFARSPLIASLGVQGGQCEAPRLEWTRVMGEDEPVSTVVGGTARAGQGLRR